MTGSGDPGSETQAKATFLAMIDVDTGYVGLVQVARKGDDPFSIRCLTSFFDRMRSDEVRIKCDSEPSILLLVGKVKNFR